MAEPLEELRKYPQRVFAERPKLARHVASLHVCVQHPQIKVKPDIRMIPIGGFSVPEEFASITAKDSVLALSFGRRSSSMRSILQSARLAGADTVSLTDQVSSGFPNLAKVTLRCRTQGLSYFDSVAAPTLPSPNLCSAFPALCAGLRSRPSELVLDVEVCLIFTGNKPYFLLFPPILLDPLGA